MPGVFKKILVPIDFSDNTEVAVKQAIELACTDGATIYLLHVLKPKTVWNMLFGSIQRSLRPDDNRSSILKGRNLPKAILEYAECIKADLMLVNPGSETKISNLTGKHINDALTTSSKLSILSIEPYHQNKISAG